MFHPFRVGFESHVAEVQGSYHALSGGPALRDLLGRPAIHLPLQIASVKALNQNISTRASGDRGRSSPGPLNPPFQWRLAGISRIFDVFSMIFHCVFMCFHCFGGFRSSERPLRVSAFCLGSISKLLCSDIEVVTRDSPFRKPMTQPTNSSPELVSGHFTPFSGQLWVRFRASTSGIAGRRSWPTLRKPPGH